jgi:hypothetical protein
MLLIQSLLYIIYIFSTFNIILFGYSWLADQLYEDIYIPQGFAGFLLLNSIYLLALSKAYYPKKTNNNIQRKIRQSNLFYVLIIILIFISTLDYLLIYTQFLDITLPPFISHIFKLLSRFRPVFTLLIIIHLWSKHSFKSTVGLAFILSIYLSIGFVSVYFTGMRQLIFEPLILILIVFFSSKKKVQLDISKFFKLALFIIIALYVYNIASSLKFADRVDNINVSLPQKTLNTIQEVSSRGSAYYADLIALSKPTSLQLFTTNKHNVFAEITYGLPLGSMLVPSEYMSPFTFDMQFFWSYNPIGISSTYVSGTSALLFTLGMPLSMLVLFIVGLIHGHSFKMVTYWLGAENSWIIIQSMLFLYFLNGLGKMDILGLPAYTIIVALIFKYFFLKKLQHPIVISNH